MSGIGFQGSVGGSGLGVLAGAIGRKCGNERRDPVRGNHQLDGL